MSRCTPEAVLDHSPRLSWRMLAGEVVILHPEAGTLHRLNDTGSAMWERLDGTRDVATIAAVLADEFDVTVDVATAELTLLADELIEAGLAEARTPVQT